MEHESFENASIAEILNRAFVCVKVDREERPDVDEAYMNFVQMSHGRGGWPLSVFLTPGRAPFFGGTYWPAEDRGGHFGFRSILLRIEELWRTDRNQLEDAGTYHQGLLNQASRVFAGSSDVSNIGIGDLVKLLSESFDPEHGGFGTAPKFPPHGAFEVLLGQYEGRELALQTLKMMALGGIHDHAGGGFHRYSTDAQWHLPHFEKMLYDNALLLASFSRAARIPGSMSSLYQDAARGIVRWLASEMTDAEGLFYSALDADSEGEEGKFYVWPYSDLLDLPDGERFAEAYGASPMGNFYDEATGLRTGDNILHRREVSDSFELQLRLLLQKRGERVRPQLDDKSIVAWNGLAILGLVEAGEPEMARRCADALLAHELRIGKLPRYIWQGKSFGDGFLEDYAFFARGLFALGALHPGYRSEAARIGTSMVTRFYDNEEGGFFATSAEHEALFKRSKPAFDQPIPSANSAAIEVLVEMGELEKAQKSFESFRPWINRAPTACEALIWCGRHFEVIFSIARIDLEGARLELDVSIPPGWTIAPAELSVTADAKPLAAEFREESISGTIRLVFRGLEANAREVEVTYVACTETECLPSQAVSLKV
jgi:uncharacterized protein YyaL (SSP411 family)